MNTVKYKNLSEIREKNKDKKIVFCSGGFDLLHAGHVIFLEDCKKMGDILVVCLGNDNVMKKYRGLGRPICDQNSRLKLISSLRCVDFAFISEETYNGNDTIDFAKAVEFLKPDIYVVPEDTSKKDKKEEFAKRKNMTFIEVKRWVPEGIPANSTTKIIAKIKNLN